MPRFRPSHWVPGLLSFCLAVVGSSGEEGGGLEEPKFYLSVGAVFRDENAYLREWIEFHLCVGVEHFFLYNHHSSTDEHVRILAPYIHAGLVTLEEARCEGHCQTPTYDACVQDHGAWTRWLAFIDVDEFLYPTEHSGFTTLPPLLRAYQTRGGGLAVHWMMYGSSNHKTNPSGLVINVYTHRAREPHPVIKTIAQPAHIRRVWAHNHQYEEGWDAVTESFQPVPFNHSTGEPESEVHPPSANVIRLNHYRTKSLEHARWRFVRDSTFRLNDFENEDVFPETQEAHEHWIARWDVNDVEDRSAQKYSTCVLEGLAKRAPKSDALQQECPHEEL